MKEQRKEIKDFIKENNIKVVQVLEKRGCDFFKNDDEMNFSDLENYRLFCKCNSVNLVSYCFEIFRGYKYRFYSLKDGHKLKKYKIEHNKKIVLWDSFEDEKGTWGDLKLEKKLYSFIDKNNLIYTKKDLIKALNHVIDFKVKDIIIVNNIYNKIDNIGGYREKSILKNCIFTSLEENNSDHEIICFYDKDLNYFKYDLKSGLIIG